MDPHSVIREKLARYPDVRYIDDSTSIIVPNQTESERSDAKALFLASSNTWKFHNQFTLGKRDSWTGYAHERDRILSACAKRNGPVILLSGDLHNSAVRQLDANILEVLTGAWSNEGFRPLRQHSEPVDLPDNGFLWLSPEYLDVKVHWCSYATLFSVDAAGRVGIEVVDLANDKIAYSKQFTA